MEQWEGKKLHKDPFKSFNNDTAMPISMLSFTFLAHLRIANCVNNGRLRLDVNVMLIIKCLHPAIMGIILMETQATFVNVIRSHSD